MGTLLRWTCTCTQSSPGCEIIYLAVAVDMHTQSFIWLPTLTNMITCARPTASSAADNDTQMVAGRQWHCRQRHCRQCKADHLTICPSPCATIHLLYTRLVIFLLVLAFTPLTCAPCPCLPLLLRYCPAPTFPRRCPLQTKAIVHLICADWS